MFVMKTLRLCIQQKVLIKISQSSRRVLCVQSTAFRNKLDLTLKMERKKAVWSIAFRSYSVLNNYNDNCIYALKPCYRTNQVAVPCLVRNEGTGDSKDRVKNNHSRTRY